jgi:hypothetical protein
LAKPGLRAALAVAVVVLAFELLTLACLRWHFFDTGFVRSMALRDARGRDQRGARKRGGVTQ